MKDPIKEDKVTLEARVKDHTKEDKIILEAHVKELLNLGDDLLKEICLVGSNKEWPTDRIVTHLRTYDHLAARVACSYLLSGNIEKAREWAVFANHWDNILWLDGDIQNLSS